MRTGRDVLSLVRSVPRRQAYKLFHRNTASSPGVLYSRHDGVPHYSSCVTGRSIMISREDPGVHTRSEDVVGEIGRVRVYSKSNAYDRNVIIIIKIISSERRRPYDSGRRLPPFSVSLRSDETPEILRTRSVCAVWARGEATDGRPAGRCSCCRCDGRSGEIFSTRRSDTRGSRRDGGTRGATKRTAAAVIASYNTI